MQYCVEVVVSVRLTLQGSLETGVIVELVWQRRGLLEEAGGGTGRPHGRLARDCLSWERKLRSCGADQYKIRSCRPQIWRQRQLGGSGLVVLMSRALVALWGGVGLAVGYPRLTGLTGRYCSAIAVLRSGEDQVNARITATWQGLSSLERLQPHATTAQLLRKHL